ncbi:phosphopantetheine-binding protein [Dokdonella sp. MW10]|uniref:phosphopantetheine-binding protein n=1 Tax=Dokdonella sp. MW10 TaxID=2992926 RepID=UPI003F821626
METIQARIRAFIHETFPTQAGTELDAGTSLFDAGVIDSIGVLTLVTWLEQEFEIVVDDDDVVPENLDGIARLTAYVEGKRRDAGLDA